MKPISVKLLNFRQHAESFVEFKNGLTVILGPNGCGKSTLLESITFALFGEQRSSKDSIRFAWATTKKYSVTYRFEHDGSTYEVMRSNDTASLTNLARRGSPIATSLGEVTKAVERLLGLTYEQYVNSYFCEQKGLAFLNFKNNSDRQKEVAKMLGFDRLQIAEDAARKQASAAKSRADALRSVMGDVALLIADVDAKTQDITALGTKKEVTGASIYAVRIRRPAVEKDAADAKKYLDLVTEINTLAGTYGALKQAVTTADAEEKAALEAVQRHTEIKDEAESLPATEKQRDTILLAKAGVEKRQGLEARKLALAGEIATIEGMLPDVTDEALALLESEKSSAEALLTAAASKKQEIEAIWNKEKSRRDADVAAAAAEFRGTRKAREEAEAKIAAGVCPSCNQPISDSVKDSLVKFQAEEDAKARALNVATALAEESPPVEIGERAAALIEASRLAREATTTLEKAREDRTKRIRLEGDIERRKESIAGVEEQLKSLPDAYDVETETRLNAEYARLKPIVEEFKHLGGAPDRLVRAVNARAKAVANMTIAKEQNEALRTKLAAYRFNSGAEADDAVKILSTLEIEAARLEEEARGIAAHERSLESALATAKARVEEYKAREAELKTVTNQASMYGSIAEEMKALRLHLNATIGPELAARASEILSLLTSGRYSVLELDDKFQVSLVDDGISKTVISGGEEDVANLALRLALSEFIQARSGRQRSLLILDEVFGSLDADRRQADLDCLIGLKGMFEQIILISHIEGTSEVADHIIYLARDPETKATIVGDGPGEFELQGEAA